MVVQDFRDNFGVHDGYKHTSPVSPDKCSGAVNYYIVFLVTDRDNDRAGNPSF